MSLWLICTLGVLYVICGATMTRTIVNTSKKKNYTKEGTTFSEDIALIALMFTWPLVLVLGFLALLAGGKTGNK